MESLKVMIYLTMFFSLNSQVSWKGKSESGGFHDPWDRLLVAVLAVSMALDSLPLGMGKMPCLLWGIVVPAGIPFCPSSPSVNICSGAEPAAQAESGKLLCPTCCP